MTTYKTEYTGEIKCNRVLCGLWYESIQTFIVFRMLYIELKCQKKEATLLYACTDEVGETPFGDEDTMIIDKEYMCK